MTRHSEATLVHRPYSWEYADEAEREAATGFVAADVGRLARQLDDDTLWMLVDDSPVTWSQVGGSSSGGGRTLIASATPTGVGSVSFTSISAAFQKLIIEYAVRGTVAATSVSMDITLNNDTTDANYQRQVITAYQLTTLAAAGGADNVIDDAVIGSTGPASEFSHGQIEILFYANTNFFKQIGYRNRKRRDTSSVQEQINRGAMDWESTAAINRVDLILASGNFESGSIINLYGEL